MIYRETRSMLLALVIVVVIVVLLLEAFLIDRRQRRRSGGKVNTTSGAAFVGLAELGGDARQAAMPAAGRDGSGVTWGEGGCLSSGELELTDRDDG
jgi:hypothetical protein